MTCRVIGKTLIVRLLPLLLAVACGESNPLLGQWEYDAEASSGLAAAGAEIVAGVSGSGPIEFREDKIVSGGKSESVSYEVAEGRVIVTGSDGKGVVYTIVDENHVYRERSTGRIALKRVGADVAAPAPEEEEAPAEAPE